MKIRIDQITVSENRRSLDEGKMPQLMDSIKILGLLQAIVVRLVAEGVFILVAGLHRLEACRRLGHVEIECIALQYTDSLANLAEIDENLVRNDLHFLDVGEQANRRDEILEACGERANSSNKGKSSSADSAPLRTTADDAKMAGMSTRAYQECKQIDRDLVAEARVAVRKWDISKTDSLSMSKLDPDLQRVIVALGSRKEIIEALLQIKPRSKPKKLSTDSGCVCKTLKTIQKKMDGATQIPDLFGGIFSAVQPQDVLVLKESRLAVIKQLKVIIDALSLMDSEQIADDGDNDEANDNGVAPLPQSSVEWDKSIVS